MTFDGLGSFQQIAEAAIPSSGDVTFDALPMGNGAANLVLNYDYWAPPSTAVILPLTL